MLRKTLTTLSLIGLLLSVGLWGVSYSPVALQGQHQIVEVSHGRLTYGPQYRWPPPTKSQFHVLQFTGLQTDWLPPFQCLGKGGYSHFHVALWLPTASFAAIFSFCCFGFPGYRRRKRKKLGLCLKCGYDLRGSKERCPECGEEFVSTPMGDEL